MISLPDISAVPALDAQTAAKTVADFVAAADLTSDPRIGAVAELVVKPNAILLARQQLWLAQYLRSRSLLDLQASPELADADAVDALLSNFRVSRLAGSLSGGQVRIVVSSNLTSSIGIGSTFTINGVAFVSPVSYTAKKEAGLLLSPDDRLIQPAPDGTFYYTVTLVSAGSSAAANVPANSVVVPDVLPSNFVRAYTLTDFAGGRSAESNADLILRLRQGIAAPTPSNRLTMQAWLRQTPAFSSFVRSSIVGAGQAEMLRSKHSLFPVDAGGRVDWWVRSSPETVTADATANSTLVSLAGDGTGTWQLSIGRGLLPGFHSVESIRPTGTVAYAGGLAVTSDVRGVDLTGLGYPAPDIATPLEGLYSRFQTAVIQFSDGVGSLAVGATRSYDFSLRGLPGIGDLQDAVSSQPQSHVGADLVVRAAVPCNVSLSLRVEKRSGSPDPDFIGMKAAIAARIEAASFTGRLYASDLLAAASAYLSNSQAIVVEDFRGTISTPGNSPIVLVDVEVLSIPMLPACMISAATCQFFNGGISIHSAVAMPATG